MGLKDFRIVFDNQWSTYYPGQTVTGNIILVLDSVKKIRGISVKIKGEANTNWSTVKQEMDEKGQYTDETQTVTAHESYFETKYYLIGSASVVTFHATTPHTDTKTEEIVVKEISKGPVEAGETVNYEQHLDIPPLPPSNLTNCHIIDLEYNLKVEACVEGWYHRNLSANTLIFVGTIPLTIYHVPSAPHVGMDGESMKPQVGFVIPSANTALPPLPESHLYPNLPPPSFEESSYGARNLHERGESEHVYGLTNHFAPRYPVYNFASAQQ
ncbi:hypothetical protein P5V15_008888 [Pogonomyrmex californicus]